MSDLRDKLAELQRDLNEAKEAPRRPGSEDALTQLQRTQAEKRRRALRRTTKRKILVGSALALAFLLVWKKVNIHFVVHTSFWGFLGLVAAVFAILYFILTYFFDDKDEE